MENNIDYYKKYKKYKKIYKSGGTLSERLSNNLVSDYLKPEDIDSMRSVSKDLSTNTRKILKGDNNICRPKYYGYYPYCLDNDDYTYVNNSGKKYICCNRDISKMIRFQSAIISNLYDLVEINWYGVSIQIGNYSYPLGEIINEPDTIKRFGFKLKPGEILDCENLSRENKNKIIMDGDIIKYQDSDDQMTVILDKNGLVSSITFTGEEGDELDPDVIAYLLQLTTLDRLYIDEYEISGEVFNSLCNLSNLKELTLNSCIHDNSIIPGCIGNLENLEILEITGNILSGTVPESINHLKHLNTVTIAYNENLDDFKFSTHKPIVENKVKWKDSYAASVFRQNKN